MPSSPLYLPGPCPFPLVEFLIHPPGPGPRGLGTKEVLPPWLVWRGLWYWLLGLSAEWRQFPGVCFKVTYPQKFLSLSGQGTLSSVACGTEVSFGEMLGPSVQTQAVSEPAGCQGVTWGQAIPTEDTEDSGFWDPALLTSSSAVKF